MEDTFCVSDYIGVRPAWVYAKCLNDYFAGCEASETPPVTLSDEELESFLVFGLQVASMEMTSRPTATLGRHVEAQDPATT